ncbi:MAG: N2,N2-dimethylguanosine tRNA methyltransferase [Prochlorococcaceae cyanobacterium ETNP7_MAG_30]|nr:N2,N2-dimethylguanosine tRNA methyltransferase [Prochlorococcaceae cyanobacterium ETNP7_MAG_30]
MGFAPVFSSLWDCPVGSLGDSCIHSGLSKPTSHYREGAAALELGDGFFRSDSRPSRDLSVLFAYFQQQTRGNSSTALHWLDLMAGCGIRALRWGLEALDSSVLHSGEMQSPVFWVNDADFARTAVLERNLDPLRQKNLCLNLSHQPAEALLSCAYLEKRLFDLIDLDCFGCPNALLQPVLQVLAANGLLLLASSDGRSPTGHDRLGAIRSLSAAARAHPSSWEMALRLQLGVIARQAWMLGRGLEPLASFSDGRTFRLAVRIRRSLVVEEENQLGFLARCESCGAQAVQPMLTLQGWSACNCPDSRGRWAVSGPLWLGPLQSADVLADLLVLAEQSVVPIASASLQLLQRLQADIGLPVFCWSTAELARRLALPGPPSVRALVQALQKAGYEACSSAVMSGQLRTNAPVAELLEICNGMSLEGR